MTILNDKNELRHQKMIDLLLFNYYQLRSLEGTWLALLTENLNENVIGIPFREKKKLSKNFDEILFLLDFSSFSIKFLKLKNASISINVLKNLRFN